MKPAHFHMSLVQDKFTDSDWSCVNQSNYLSISLAGTKPAAAETAIKYLELILQLPILYLDS